MIDVLKTIPFALEFELDKEHAIRLVGHEYRKIKVTPQECVDCNKTYAVELWGTFEVTRRDFERNITSSPKLLAEIPIPVNDEFIWASPSGMKANRYVLVKQLAKSPGIYYSMVVTGDTVTEYCRIRPACGVGILLTKTTSSKRTRCFPRLTNDMQLRYENLQDVWKALNGNFAVGPAGKLQLHWASRYQIDPGIIEFSNPQLTFQELHEINKLFEGGLLRPTDDRSLATRRVLRYEADHLPQLLRKSARSLARTLGDAWPEVKHSLSQINDINRIHSQQIFNQLIPQKPIQQIFDSFFSYNDLFQLLDTTNPLSEFSQKRRLTLKGPGGYPDKSMLLDKRDVHWTDFGRVCPVETPQGKDLGFSLYLVKDARVDELGFLCAKYVTNNENKEEVWLNVHDEISARIVAGDGRLKNGTMQARRYDGVELSDADPTDLTHGMPTPDSHLGYAASLIPFFQHNDANRALMGANMMKQALSLLHNEPPLVQTGYETELAKNVADGDRFCRDGCLSLGTNLLVGYMPWDFYTYEDAVAISDSLVRHDKLTHIETEEIYFEAVVARWRNFKGEYDKVVEQPIYEVITSDNEYLEKVFESDSPQGIEKLVRFMEFSHEDIRDLNAFIDKLKNDDDVTSKEISDHVWEKIGIRSRSIITDGSKDEVERKTELASSLNALIHDRAFYLPFFNSSREIREECNRLITGVPLANEIIRVNRAIIEDVYPQYLVRSSDIIFDGVIREGSEFGPGDLLVSRLRLLPGDGSDSAEKCAAAFLKNYLKNNSLKIGVTESMEDTSLYAAEGISGKIVKTEWVDSAKDRRRLKIVFETRHQVKVGDKLTGRHGNKGVISRIIPEHEMPYFYSAGSKCSDKSCTIKEPHTHLEMLINPLTVTSRMNLGQLYETTSSWISVANGDVPVFAPPFGTDLPWEAITGELSKHGLPVKYKLFHTVKGKEQALGTDKTEAGVTVGFQYILKLKHLSDKKLKSRNQSALSPSTGQPITSALSNKSDIRAVWGHRQTRKQSAQRLGEMEVWALQGHEAWNLLDELIFLKSDSENLKQLMISAMHESYRSRRKAFKEFETIAVETYRWNVRTEGESLIVTCSDEQEPWLKQAAEPRGIKVSRNGDGTYTLTHSPLEIFHRNHRALRSFVLYCRGVGLEVKGYDEKDRQVELVNRDKDHFPRLASISIQVASDKDRCAWSERKITSYRGDGKHGLWPEEWNSQERRDPGLEKKFNEQCDYIELPVPIDNPLFRKIMCTLLSMKGCLLDPKFMVAFQELLTKRIQKYKDYTEAEWYAFWQEQLSKRSRLLMREDAVLWLRELAAPDHQDDATLNKWLDRQTGIAFNRTLRRALPERLTAKNDYALFPTTTTGLSKINESEKHKKLTKAAESCRLHIRDLYRHFELMDFKVLRERLDGSSHKSNDSRLANTQKALLDILIESDINPTDFFIKNLSVLPRNLRHEQTSPYIKTSRSSVSHYAYENDLNYLYQHILIATEHIKKTRELYPQAGSDLITPDMEERRLRPLVHALLSNRREIMTPVKRKSGRPLHGIIDFLAGRTASKEGFFCRHLLGKRTDYSGRAVIIPDPELGIDETSVPFSMGLKIFKDILVSYCMKDLNLVPSMEPIRQEDGSVSRKTRPIPEASRIALAKRIIGDSSNREEVRKWLVKAAETHLVLLNRAPSLHRLSILSFHVKFHDNDDCIHLNPLVCAPFNADFDGDTMAVHVPFLPSSIADAKRMLPSNILRSPADGKLRIDFKKDHALAAYLFDNKSATEVYGQYENASRLHDGLREVAQTALATTRERLKQCGVSLSVNDFMIDQEYVQKGIESARQNMVSEVTNARKRNPKLSKKEAFTNYWQESASNIAKKLADNLKLDSPIKVLRESGATKVDLQQLSAMRGIMMKPVDPETTSDNLVEWPIFSSIVSGMTPLEYFVSCHGSRNGLADKGLLTAPAGDVTNTMIQAAQGISVIEDDCGTRDGILFVTRNPRRLMGRYLASDVYHEGELLLTAGTEISGDNADKLALKKNILLRSPVTCHAKNAAGKGICQKCYGRERVRNELPPLGYPAGIIAAQSIGEKGTQLTLSSFHTGGAAGTKKFGIMDARRMIMKLDSRVAHVYLLHGKQMAAVVQLHLFQKKIYSECDIADHHLELIISTMFTDRIRPILEAAKAGDGFLSRLAFKEVESQLVMAALRNEHDALHDIKSIVMIGQIL